MTEEGHDKLHGNVVPMPVGTAMFGLTTQLIERFPDGDAPCLGMVLISHIADGEGGCEITIASALGAPVEEVPSSTEVVEQMSRDHVLAMLRAVVKTIEGGQMEGEVFR